MILILSGLPASGKTTESLKWVAESHTRHRINYDDIRVRLYGSKGPSYYSQGAKLVRACEEAVKAEALSVARAWLTMNPPRDVVIDNTNLTDRARAPWVNLGKELGIEVVLQDVDTPVAECVRRDRQRKGDDRVGRAVIERMALTTGWIDWDDSIYGNRKFCVFDVDGTLADSSRRAELTLQQTPKNWDLFFKDVASDPPRQPIVELAKIMALQFHIIVLSGRPMDKCGIATEDWLVQHSVPCCHLFMRPANDKRPDTEVKLELLDLLPKRNITYIIDDRDSVVAAFRGAGMTVLQCAPGAF